MQQHPFQESTLSSNKKRKTFLMEHCEDYSFSVMAIVFGIGIVLSGMVIAILGVLISAIHSFSYLPYICLAAWTAFASWLWISLVLIGKENRESRVSDVELLVMQALCFGLVLVHVITSPTTDRMVFHQISLMFEWVILGFHVLYFLLALCVWVRLPLRVYPIFALLLALAIYQSMNF